MSASGGRKLVTLISAAFVVASVVLPAQPASAVIDPAGIISNGTVKLGINVTGELNVDEVGITYIPTDGDGISPDCDCEGWGAADETSTVSGWATQDNGSTTNVATESFTITADTAVSTVLIPDATTPTMRVTHNYHPSVTPNLYEVTVTIENLSPNPIIPRYRRVMDWDIPPTEFDEYVTIQGTASSSRIVAASDNGFAEPDALAPLTWINFTGDAIDNLDTVLTPGGFGPDSDHGALFDFRFPSLAPTASSSFNIYYGAASTEAEANVALAAVNAEIYSYGQANVEDGPTLGIPNTFIFAFQGVGGLVQIPTVSLSSATYTGQEGSNGTVQVNLSGATSNPVTVDYTTSAGTATPGTDYTETTGTLTIPAGQTSGTFAIPLAADAVVDPGETVDIAISNPTNAILGTPTAAVLTITEPPPPTTTTTTAPIPVAAVAVVVRPTFAG